MIDITKGISGGVESFYVFVCTQNGEERVSVYIDPQGKQIPLVYRSLEDIDKANVRELVRSMAEHHKVYFGLRRYELKAHIESFYPPMLET